MLVSCSIYAQFLSAPRSRTDEEALPAGRGEWGTVTMTKRSSQGSPLRARLLEAFEDICNDGEHDLAKLEPAWGKAALFFRTGYRLGHILDSLRCISLADVHRMLSVYRVRFEKGDTLSLLQAVGICAEENLPLPTWLAHAFRSRMTAFLRPGKLRSLDDIFCSVNLPTGSAKKAAAVRQDWQLAGKLWQDAWEIARDDQMLSSFDRVIERLLSIRSYGVGKTKAKQLVTMIENNQGRLLGKDLSLSRFLEKRRKLQT